MLEEFTEKTVELMHNHLLPARRYRKGCKHPNTSKDFSQHVMVPQSFIQCTLSTSSSNYKNVDLVSARYQTEPFTC